MGDDVRVGKIGGVFEGVVCEPEDVEADLFALRKFVLIMLLTTVACSNLLKWWNAHYAISTAGICSLRATAASGKNGRKYPHR
ncbi:MAG: hypothetical protein HC846_02920 [Blastocatellia bacterium]|nr:hypothetical protein [Blastocatellia bacterium]